MYNIHLIHIYPKEYLWKEGKGGGGVRVCMDEGGGGEFQIKLQTS